MLTVKILLVVRDHENEAMEYLGSISTKLGKEREHSVNTSNTAEVRLCNNFEDMIEYLKETPPFDLIIISINNRKEIPSEINEILMKNGAYKVALTSPGIDELEMVFLKLPDNPFNEMYAVSTKFVKKQSNWNLVKLFRWLNQRQKNFSAN